MWCSIAIEAILHQYSNRLIVIPELLLYIYIPSEISIFDNQYFNYKHWGKLRSSRNNDIFWVILDWLWDNVSKDTIYTFFQYIKWMYSIIWMAHKILWRGIFSAFTLANDSTNSSIIQKVKFDQFPFLLCNRWYFLIHGFWARCKNPSPTFLAYFEWSLSISKSSPLTALDITRLYFQFNKFEVICDIWLRLELIMMNANSDFCILLYNIIV